MEKKKTWRRRRHKVIIEIARVIMGPYLRIRYGVKPPKRKDLIREQSLILLNHQTPMDQFLVGLWCRDPVYYLATEDIFSNGWVSSLIRWAVAPIPIKKQATDPKAVMQCIRVVREGGSLCIAPEGNRTYSGKTEYMNPAIGGLARKLGLPIVLFAIDGGYGMEPRWSNTVRKGRLTCRVTRIISPSEAKAMTNDQVFQAIQEGLMVNEAVRGPEYRGKHLAEYLERAIYLCPKCGITHFESRGDVLRCTGCGSQTRYNPDKTLTGLNWDCPYTFVNDWYQAQKDYVNQLDTAEQTGTPLCTDTADLYQVHLYKNKALLEKQVPIAMYGDRLVLGERELAFSDISTMAMLGKNKVNIYHAQGLYQLKGSKRFNGLKYVHLYYRSKNIAGDKKHGEFLGL